MNMNKQHITLLVPLDLSTAFNTAGVKGCPSGSNPTLAVGHNKL